MTIEMTWEEQERRRYYEDLELNGNYKSFDYRGQFCEIKRDNTLHYLCGYITVASNDLLSSFSDLENKWNITFHSGNKIGIDCAHGHCDFIPNHYINMPNTTYKNFDWVEAELKRIVDDICEN